MFRAAFAAALGVGSLSPTLALAQAAGAASRDGDYPAPELCMEVWDSPLPLMPPRSDGAVRGFPTLEMVITDQAPDADLPYDVEYLPDGNTVVVVHGDTDNVTFIDVDARVAVDTVAVGDYPTDIAVSPDGRYVVVPSVFDNTVTVIDAATRTVAATIPVTGLQPYAVKITADGNYAVVGVINDAVNSAFSIIDLDTLTEVRSIPTVSQGVTGGYATPESGTVGNTFTDFAVSPDSATIVLPLRSSAADTVHFYDLTTGADLGSVSTGGTLISAVDISNDGSTAVVSHEGNSSGVSVIDVPSRTFVNYFPAPDSLYNQIVRITPDERYAIASLLNDVTVIDLTTGDEAVRIGNGSAGDIEFSHDGEYAFIAYFTSRVVDLDTLAVVSQLPVALTHPAATSPTENRAVAINNRNRENIHFYNINGSAGFVEGVSPTGEPVEGDATRDLAISGDGRTALANNNLSANTCVIDLPTGLVRAWIHTGERPLAAAITPDNRWGVVCNTDEGNGTVSIIDMQTDTVVATLNTPQRPSAIRISPDSSTAYVLTIAGTDMIYFIDIDGANSSVISTAPAGQAGSWGGPAYSGISGIELSPDGSVLAVADSFNDTLNLFDTATRTRFATVPVGDFPMVPVFSPDGSRVYVSNAFGGSLSVVEVNGAASSHIVTVPAMANPYAMAVDPSGDYVYIANAYAFIDPGSIMVFDTATNSFVATVDIGAAGVRDMHMRPDGTLLAALTGTNGLQLLELDAAGPATFVTSSTPLSGEPSDMVFSESLGIALLAQPARIPDGLDLVRFGVSCAADRNGDNVVDASDITAFLSAWFADRANGTLDADFNGSGVVDASDITAFLSAWFADRASGNC